MSAISLISNSIADVPAIWTPLIKGSGEEHEDIEIEVRIPPSLQLSQDLNDSTHRTKSVSDREKERLQNEWVIEKVCQTFVDSRNLEAVFTDSSVERYRKHIPEIEPGLVCLDGRWTEALKRQFFKDDPLVCGLIFATVMKAAAEQKARVAETFAKKGVTSRAGSPSV